MSIDRAHFEAQPSVGKGTEDILHRFISYSSILFQSINTLNLRWTMYVRNVGSRYLQKKSKNSSKLISNNYTWFSSKKYIYMHYHMHM